MPLYIIPQRYALRGATASELYARNEVLLDREFCQETDTGRFKLGDGQTPWNDLPYTGYGGADLSSLADGQVLAYNATSGLWEPSVGISDGDKGDIVVSDSGATWSLDAGVVDTAELADNAVTNAKAANMAASTIKARKTASTGDPEDCTLSEVLDMIGSAAQGDILYRGSSGWARLGAGTSGHVLTTGGTGANPSWAAASGGGGGGKYEYVGTATVAGSAATSITLSGLDLATDQHYMAFFALKGAVASNPLNLFFNSDTTATNYYTQFLLATGTSVLGQRSNNASFSDIENGQALVGVLHTTRDIDGNPRTTYHLMRNQTTTSYVFVGAHMRNNTANVTSMTLQTNTASGLAVGSYFRLFKVHS